MIRNPVFSDVPAMIDLIRWAHARSVYADLTPVDHREANRVLVNLIQRHGGRGEAGTWVQVAERDGKVVGLFIGVLNRTYQVFDGCTATDLVWLAGPDCSLRDAVAMMLSFVDWAKAHRKVVEIVCNASSAFGPNDEVRLAKALEKIGFERFGGLWRIVVARKAEEVAA